MGLTYLSIALGSALGGMTRYWFTGLATRLISESFPWGTLLVNVSGSLVIGILAALVPEDGRLLFVPDARAFFMIGLCGGYTTFSSFSLETLNLARNGEWLAAATYVGASVLACLLAVAVGYFATSALRAG